MGFLKTVHPVALLLVAIAIVISTMSGAGGGTVRKLLWIAAAVLAVVGAVATWRK